MLAQPFRERYLQKEQICFWFQFIQRHAGFLDQLLPDLGINHLVRHQYLKDQWPQRFMCGLIGECTLDCRVQNHSCPANHFHECFIQNSLALYNTDFAGKSERDFIYSWFGLSLAPRPYPSTVESNSSGQGYTEHRKAELLVVLQRLLRLLQLNGTKVYMTLD